MSKPIPHRYLQGASGRTYSFFSAAPLEPYTVETKGWTVQHPDGTVGIGRPPFATEEAAKAWCDAHPNFPGMNQG